MNPIIAHLIIIAAFIIIGIPILLGVAAFLWNKKWVPMKQSKGIATASFGHIMKRTIRFISKEEDLKLFPKVKNPKLSKILSMRGIYWILFLVGIVLAIIGNFFFWIPIALLFFTALGRTTDVFGKRHKILMRMFEVSASEFHYGRGAEMNPWNYVNIKKWESLVVPGETLVSFPTAYKAESIMARESFERHFNGTVTEDNTWIYTWKSAASTVVCEPVSHLPTLAAYPGTEKAAWDEFIVGVGAQGEVGFNLSKTPHALICGSTGAGKALSLSTPLLGAFGWTTIGDLKTGDTIYGPDGKPTKVTHLHPIVTPAKAYKITFKSGETLVADADHLWETLTKKETHALYKQENPATSAAWLTDTQIGALKNLYENSTSDGTIDIAGVKSLLGQTSSSALYRVAKQVGVAELVRKTVYVSYKNQKVTRPQRLSTVSAEEFKTLYNDKTWIPTTKNPLTSYMYEKLVEYASGVREVDSVSPKDVISYLGVDDEISLNWLNNNLNTDLSAYDMLQEVSAKAKLIANPFPTKVFDITTATGNVSFLDFALLCPSADHKEVKNFFYYLTKKAATKKIETFQQTQNFPSSDHSIQTAPIEFYPTKLYVKALLQRAGVIVGDTILPTGAQIRTTEEILQTLTAGNYLYKGDTLASKNHYIRSTTPLNTPEALLPVQPYSLGAYIGDGYSSSGRICGADLEVFENIEKEGYAVTNILKRANGADQADFWEYTYEELSKALRNLGVAHRANKFNNFYGEIKSIPFEYLTASEVQRRQLLRGLLDTDGTVRPNGDVQFDNTNKNVIDSVVTLVASLGYIPKISHDDSKNVNYKTVYHITFTADPADVIFGLQRKNVTHQERYTSTVSNHMAEFHKIVSVEETEPVPMRCISVDSEDRLFLVGKTLVPTHNSVLQRNLIFHCIQHNDMWRFLGVDVKRVELTPFNKYKETVLGIGANLEDGVEIVRYAKDVMMQRYEEMEGIGVNHFLKLTNEQGKPPYAIMLMIDEAFMFMSPEGQRTDEGKVRDQLHGEASTLLGDIARLGRAAGIHLILATQRPDATVIKGELKANLDIRIAAGRLDSTPSSMVLDSGAATLLPGHIKGRGVIRTGGETEQFQGYFADQDWIDAWLQKPENRHREPSITGATQGIDNDPSRLEIPEEDLVFTNEIDEEFQAELASGILDEPLVTPPPAVVVQTPVVPTPTLSKTVPVLPTPTPIVTNTSSFTPVGAVKPVVFEEEEESIPAESDEDDDDDDDDNNEGGETQEEYMARILAPETGSIKVVQPEFFLPEEKIEEPVLVEQDSVIVEPKAETKKVISGFPAPPFPRQPAKPPVVTPSVDKQLDIDYDY